MIKEKPLVTVVALSFNHAGFLYETLNSIRDQHYKNFELIIVDDASKDNSANLIANWIAAENFDCRFIQHKENYGLCKSLNETLLYATGDFYKVIACDDILLPSALEDLVDTLSKLSPAHAMVYADVVPIDKEGSSFGNTPFTDRGWTSDEIVPQGHIFSALCEYCFIPAPSVLLRTSVIKEMKFDETLYMEDWDLWLRISKKYLIKGIAKAVVKYRIHVNSMYQMKSPLYRDAELRTVEKHLGFDSKGDIYLKNFIYKNSILLYMHGGLRPAYWLWKRFLIKKNVSNFLHVLLAIAGISYRTKQKFEQLKWSKRSPY